MGKGLIERSPKARELFERAGEILGYDLLKVCLEGPKSCSIRLTEVSRLCLSIRWRLWKSSKRSSLNGSKSVVAVAGLSLGEYSALASAGAINLEDGLRLVQSEARQCKKRATDRSGSKRYGQRDRFGVREGRSPLCDVASRRRSLASCQLALSWKHRDFRARSGFGQGRSECRTSGAMKFIRLSWLAGHFIRRSCSRPWIDSREPLAALPCHRFGLLCFPTSMESRIRTRKTFEAYSPSNWCVSGTVGSDASQLDGRRGRSICGGGGWSSLGWHAEAHRSKDAM